MSEELARLASGWMLISGWIVLVAFGLLLYFDLRGVPKDVIGARLFLNIGRVARGFLVLSIGFATVLIAAVPGRFGISGAAYGGLAGTVVWLACTLYSLHSIFFSFHVPRDVRRKFGTPAR